MQNLLNKLNIFIKENSVLILIINILFILSLLINFKNDYDKGYKQGFNEGVKSEFKKITSEFNTMLTVNGDSSLIKIIIRNPDKNIYYIKKLK